MINQEFYTACKGGNIKLVGQYLSKKIDINAKNIILLKN